MTTKPIAFRPSQKSLRIIKDYIAVNQLQGKGAWTIALNELIEAHENVVIFPIMEYRMNRNNRKLKKRSSKKQSIRFPYEIEALIKEYQTKHHLNFSQAVCEIIEEHSKLVKSNHNGESK